MLVRRNSNKIIKEFIMCIFDDVLNDDISLPEDVFDTEKFLNRLLEV